MSDELEGYSCHKCHGPVGVVDLNPNGNNGRLTMGRYKVTCPACGEWTTNKIDAPIANGLFFA